MDELEANRDIVREEDSLRYMEELHALHMLCPRMRSGLRLLWVNGGRLPEGSTFRECCFRKWRSDYCLQANRLDKLHSPLATEWKPLPFPIRTAYVNFGHPSLPIYQNLRYFTMDLRLKIEVLHTPIMQAANDMPKRLAPGVGQIGCLPHKNNSFSTSGLAGAMGGALEGSPRHARIF